MIKVQKTIKCKVIKLTKVRRKLLDQEYDNLQRFLRGDSSVRLYSANKQQAKRYYRKVKEGKKYPLSLRRDLIRVERRDTKAAKYWAKIPVAGRYGGVWVAIKPHQEIPEDVEICESKLFKRGGEFYINLTIQKKVNIPEPKLTVKTVVIACDIGEANPIASVELWEDGKERRNVQFLGREIRAIRAHYNHLKKAVGRKKIKHAVGWIKQHVGHKEERTANDMLHKATRKIVDRAKDLRNQGYEPIIIFGDLKRVRKKRVKGKTRCRRNNRKVHTMPSYKTKHMLTYKALWEGMPVIPVNEAYTTKLCWRCGSMNTEIVKRFFYCKDCGLEYNKDLNGAVNIGNRLLGYMLESRASVNMPQTSPEFITPKGDMLVIQGAREEARPRVGE